MRITSSVEYATRVMVRLSALPPDETATAENLSEAENIPRDYIDQLMLRLRRAGLVLSRRGAQGGYALAKPADKISVSMIVCAVEESVFDLICERFARGEKRCSRSAGCGIRPTWGRLAKTVETFLEGVSVAQLAAEDDCHHRAKGCS
ncbi:MAG: Rrf2 family transcriptional regulator [Elusimicrobiota bacterium]|jgi:Rrf2 family protein